MTMVVKINYPSIESNVEYCKSFLRSMQNFVKEITFSIFKDYPNNSQGKLLVKVNFDGVPKNIFSFIRDHNKDNAPISDLIFQFDFKLKYKNLVFDGYFRINNYILSRCFGNFEFDIFPKGEILNFGDLVYKYNLSDIIFLIEEWIKEISKVYSINIRQAFVGTSDGDSREDVSKRIWLFYGIEKDYLVDVIRFVKNINDLNVPKYLKDEYFLMIKQLRPYSENFVAKEFFSSEKFRGHFQKFAELNDIKISGGSLYISSVTPDNTFALVRNLVEKLIFPVMEHVTGEDQFRDIVNKELSEVK